MSILIRDDLTGATLTATFAAATELEEVRASDGRLLGHFAPAPPPKMSFPELGITDDEIDRILHDPNATWVTPEDVMARLREIDRCSP